MKTEEEIKQVLEELKKECVQYDKDEPYFIELKNQIDFIEWVLN